MRIATTLCAALLSSAIATAGDTAKPAEMSKADLAGEAVTIPKEWTGVWETEGYTKIWVIYSQDGSGL